MNRDRGVPAGAAGRVGAGAGLGGAGGLGGMGEDLLNSPQIQQLRQVSFSVLAIRGPGADTSRWFSKIQL